MNQVYVIKDWANNILTFKGQFELECFAVPMQFETEDDAFVWLDENISDEVRNDLFVEAA